MQTKQIFYKSDFSAILSFSGGWLTPFRLKFWTNSPSRSFTASFDGTTYTNCSVLSDGRLQVAFDSHNMGLGTLMLEPEFYLTNQAYNDHICNEVIKPFAPVFKDSNNVEYNVALDMTGSSTMETIGTLPAYYQKGDKGDAFTYADFTDEQKAELQKPATDAAAEVLADQAEIREWADETAADFRELYETVSQAVENTNTATALATAATTKAERVNATMNGTSITVTDHDGNATTTNLKGDKGDKGDQGPSVPIVDNCTTSDSTKALSAKQGKVLKEITDVLEATDEGILESIGDIDYLETTEKGNIVDAVNEVNAKIGNTDISSIGNSVTNAIHNTYISIGDMKDLETEEKDSLVDAINEDHAKLSELEGNVGNLANLETSVKTDLVSAINEARQSGGGGGGGSTTIVDNLTSTSTTSALSANQGRVLKGLVDAKGTYTKPSNGIPKTDLESAVQTSLGKADTALQSHQSLSAYRKASAQDTIDATKATKIGVASAIPSGGMLPNTFYNLGELSGSVSLTMADATDNTIVNVCSFQFSTPSTAPSITWDAKITKWQGGNAPTINASKTYEVSVLNGVGLIIEI